MVHDILPRTWTWTRTRIRTWIWTYMSLLKKEKLFACEMVGLFTVILTFYFEIFIFTFLYLFNCLMSNLMCWKLLISYREISCLFYLKHYSFIVQNLVFREQNKSAHVIVALIHYIDPFIGCFFGLIWKVFYDNILFSFSMRPEVRK